MLSGPTGTPLLHAGEITKEGDQKVSLFLKLIGQYLCTVLGDGDGDLPLGGELAVAGQHNPVTLHLGGGAESILTW